LNLLTDFKQGHFTEELLACEHRRSQGGGKGAMPPQIFRTYIVISCFERRFSKQNNVIRQKLNILARPIFLVPQIFGLATTLRTDASQPYSESGRDEYGKLLVK